MLPRNNVPYPEVSPVTESLKEQLLQNPVTRDTIPKH